MSSGTEVLFEQLEKISHNLSFDLLPSFLEQNMEM